MGVSLDSLHDLGVIFKGVILRHRLLMNVESTPYFRRLASISVLGEREEGAGWWLGSIILGGKRLGCWKGL